MWVAVDECVCLLFHVGGCFFVADWMQFGGLMIVVVFC